ncbi:MAG TPA: prolyl oligopeptidase family serine peptidase, partial [Acidimicrobiales bacterium]|nr:prolyl oligopeptidase family serine peptidase [Acidimicrobiales bacterium]
MTWPSAPPPPAAGADGPVEVVHGITVADPYRWLEAGDQPETRAWVGLQNDRTRRVLDEVPGRAELHGRLSALLRAGSSVACATAGERVFSLDRWGRHDQAVLVVRPAAKPGLARTIVDPVMLSGDPTSAIDWYHPSRDGSLVAFGLSSRGDERSTLHVVDVRSGGRLDEAIPHTRAASVAWAPDGSGFAYTRYPLPGEAADTELEYWRKVYWHQLGEPHGRDRVVWEDLPDKTAWPNVSLSKDGRWLLVHVSLGWSRVDVHLIDRATGVRTAMIEGVEAVSSFEVVGDQVIGVTTLDADRGRVVSAPLVAAWHDNWCTIVAEGPSVIEATAATPSSLLVLRSDAAVAVLDRYDHDGTNRVPVELPELGSVVALSASDHADRAFLSYTSFARPPTLLRWTPGEVVDWSRLGEGDGALDGPHGTYVVEQVHYPSTDGTEVPMFLIRAGETVPGADTPCVLTGYGGFAVSMGPAYSAAIVAVCDDGGLYAVANIRGGSEYGESWHRAGMRERKQQSFDDFAAAADWLVATGHTSRDRLAIRGGSNGGLLMGATITQRPDICRAAQIAVPLLDMVRYPRFLIAELWIPEYGNPDLAHELAWLYGYSPYHHVVDGACYPAVLLTTAEDDSRVDPMHARKMAARLQAATSCGEARPIRS